MNKSHLNVTIDRDLIEFAKDYAKYQRTSVSDIFTQFLLNLKRVKNNDITETIIADPDFKKSMLNTMSRIKKGNETWFSYDEVFDESSI